VQQFPLVTLAAFRRVLEQHECRWSQLAQEDDGGILYAIERGEGDDLRFAVIHIWETSLPVPLDVIRSVCAALDLGLDLFGVNE
jgi:hypothetical protein